MRHLCGLLGLAGALVFCGCGNKDESAAPSPAPPTAVAPASPTPAPAPAVEPANRDGYLGQLARGQQVAVKGIDTASLNHEVELFQAQEGRLPKDLKELVEMKYLGKLPDPPPGMKINYDPVSGKVTVVPQ